MGKKRISIEEADNGVIVRTTTETKTRKGDYNFKESTKVLTGAEAKSLMSLVSGRSRITRGKKKK